MEMNDKKIFFVDYYTEIDCCKIVLQNALLNIDSMLSALRCFYMKKSFFFLFNFCSDLVLYYLGSSLSHFKMVKVVAMFTIGMVCMLAYMD